MLRIDAASHACVIYDKCQRVPGSVGSYEALQAPMTTKPFGLFGQVITDPSYRSRGLSTTVVGAVISRWDLMGGGYLILGTGSRHAAKVYGRNGFVHLAGGLDSDKKGYNPDDAGEWIMIRPPPGNGAFELKAFVRGCYNLQGKKEQFEIRPVSRENEADLIFLFNVESAETNAAKLPSAGIMDGTEAEEAVVKLLNEADATEDPTDRPVVCIDRVTKRVHGIALKAATLNPRLEYEAYAVCSGAFASLGAWASTHADAIGKK